MEELFLLFRVIKERKVHQFKGVYRIQQRLNPYNPLSYLVLIIDCTIGTLLYGIVGYWKNFVNPFKYR